jgi:hypothetical protein
VASLPGADLGSRGDAGLPRFASLETITRSSSGGDEALADTSVADSIVHGKQILRRHTSAGGVQLQFANGFALDAIMHHSPSALEVAQTQAAQLLAADSMIEQGSQYRPVSYTLQRVRGRASKSLRACASPNAGVEPSLLLEAGRFTPSTGLPATALRSQR